MSSDHQTGRTPLNGLSHVWGETSPPLSDRTIGQWLDDTAARWPDHPACVFSATGLRWTWAQLRDEADRLAGALMRALQATLFSAYSSSARR